MRICKAAAAILLVAAGLAGCQALPPLPGREAPGEAEEAAVPPAEAALPPRPAEKPPAPAADGVRLVGLTPEAAAELLGEPKERREEAPATVWAYVVGACRLELYFYYDVQNQRQRTLAYDLQAPGGGEGARRVCLVHLTSAAGSGGDDGQ